MVNQIFKKTFKKPGKTIVLCSLVLAFAAPFALAYIPPSSFLIHMVSRKHSGYKTVEVQTQVSAIESGKPTATHFKDVTFYVPATGVLKSWALDSNGAVLYFVESSAKTIPPASGVLLDSHPIRLSESLKDAGIPVLLNPPAPAPSGAPEVPEAQKTEPEKTALRKTDSPNVLVVAWVIGTDAAAPQLWIEKDTFLPMRILFPSAEIRMERYRFFEDFPYPQDTTVYQPSAAKDPVLKSELLSVRVDDPGVLPKEAAETGLTPAGNSSPSDLRDLIKTYYQFVR
jgi:hypothetical protein